jgi:hypothetical protein
MRSTPASVTKVGYKVRRTVALAHQPEASGIMSSEIVWIAAVTFGVWIVAALVLTARAKRRRDAKAAANRRFDGVWS